MPEADGAKPDEAHAQEKSAEQPAKASQIKGEAKQGKDEEAQKMLDGEAAEEALEEVEEEAEGEEGGETQDNDATQTKKKKKRRKGGGLFGFVAQSGDDEDEGPSVDADHRPRVWDFSFEMRSWTNTSSDRLSVFFAVSLERNDDLQQRKVVLNPKYTPIFTVKANEKHTLDKPERMFSRRTLKMRYIDLEKHRLRIDMWKMSTLTFNTYTGICEEPLSKVALKESDMSTIIRKKKKMKPGTKLKEMQPVAQFDCTIVLEEIMDFSLTIDHWGIDTSAVQSQKIGDLPALQKKYRKQLQESCRDRKRLTFIFPRDRHARPGDMRNPVLGSIA